MALSIREQCSLRRIECSLRRSDRQFAAMMSALAALAPEGKMPQHEPLTPRSASGCLILIGAVLRLMLGCATAARLLWLAIRWLGTELTAVLRTGRHPHHAADAGTSGATR